ETARDISQGRVVTVATAPGDRLDEKLREIGAICAAKSDILIAYEMTDRRGREPGSVARQLAEGAAGCDVEVVLEVRDAVRTGMSRCRPGDVLVVGCASSLDDLTAAIPDAQEITDLSPGDMAERQATFVEPAWLPLETAHPVVTERHRAMRHH